MEPLFRLMLSRPAMAQSEDAPSIHLSQNSQFQVALGQAQLSEKRREAMKTVARNYIIDPQFVGDPKSLTLYENLKKLDVALDDLEGKQTVTNTDVVNAVQAVFAATPADLVNANTLDAPTASLRDSSDSDKASARGTSALNRRSYESVKGY